MFEIYIVLLFGDVLMNFHMNVEIVARGGSVANQFVCTQSLNYTFL